MHTDNPAILDCFCLVDLDPVDLEQIREAFSRAIPIPMRQAWRKELEPGFMPATIRTGWRDDKLLLFAELTDVDIFNAATSLNQCTWLLGDVLEVFLQPVDQPGYVEFHVTPENNRLQLAFPRAGGKAQVIQDRPFHSQTWVDQDGRRWSVYMEVPTVSVIGNHKSLLDRQCRVSFSRYDYTRGRNQPVISSTSAHQEPDFHRFHEWSLLHFQTIAP